uniref:Uncharacterized protein n=1 Tax=Lotus japonicus TaxID=34305 RepID=I3SFT1_LOTJA|nr:unknown [Lotus japonicus]
MEHHVQISVLHYAKIPDVEIC